MDLIFSFAFFLFSNVIVFIMDRKKRLIINSKFYIKVAQTKILTLNLEGLIYIRVRMSFLSPFISLSSKKKKKNKNIKT